MPNVLSGVAIVLLLSFSAPAPGFSQPESSELATKAFFAGKQLLVTYREGGPLYGTFFFLNVHFCRSGHYMTFGESRRHTILDNEQVNKFSDRGLWEIATFQGQVVLKYSSVFGQSNSVPVRVLPTGGVWMGEGVSAVRQGAAQCQN